MRYQLREDLSCCDVDGTMIFLDVAQDRYFKLPHPLEEAMRRFRAREDVDPKLLEDLAAKSILVDVTGPAPQSASASNQLPSCSAVERPVDARWPSPSTVFEVMAIVWSVRRRLHTRTLKTNLDEARAYRDRKAGLPRATTNSAFEESLLLAAWHFANSRRYVPIEPVCLLDSLSLLHFLSRRGLPANIVFGVAAEPFAAHCWVQAGDMVLNETLSDACAHTPIRTV